MANSSYLLKGLSDFWQRFFADSDQLDAMYKGTESLIAQVYLDLLSNVLNISMVDAPIFNKEYWKLITIREDELSFKKGATLADNTWVYTLTDNVVNVQLLENKIIEPTAALQVNTDYIVADTALNFYVDPTDPNRNGGTPLSGYAFRKVDIEVGGVISDSAVVNWLTDTDVKKGDIVRLINVKISQQEKISDHYISVVRDTGVYVSNDTPFSTATTNQVYVILRKPNNTDISLEQMTFSGNDATLAHTRLVQGSVKVYGKAPGGEDVVENVDYIVDYEGGKIHKLTSWLGSSINKIDYSWLEEIFPAVGVSPRTSATGIVALTSSVRVTQIALWAPDVLVDRQALYLNFGSLIGVEAISSESYRAFLRGVFQLYILGPVIERIESALNVILGLPVIRDDGEILVNYDNTDPIKQIITTVRINGSTAVYEYPAATPLRSDVKDPTNYGVLTFSAFEPLSTACTVTDYIEDPNWWDNIVIPKELFSSAGGEEIPSTSRRTVTPLHYNNTIGALDEPEIGDPGLMVGADEEGTVPPPGHPVLRKKMAFVLMDRFLKVHMFFVKFDNSVFITTDPGVQFARNPDELKRLVFDSKPAYTYIYVQPQSTFTDAVLIADDKYYQPQNYGGANYDSSEIRDLADLVPGHPSILLGLFIDIITPFENKVIFADYDNAIGGFWSISDFYSYWDDSMVGVSFPTTAPVTIPYTLLPSGSRTFETDRIYINGTIGGLPLVENIDYTVDYYNNTISRITAWDSTTVDIKAVVIIRGNNSIDTANPSIGEQTYMIGQINVDNFRANYDATAVDKFGSLWPVTNHRDLSLVERAIMITVTGGVH